MMIGFVRLFSLLIASTLLSACGVLIPYQVTETISIDDSNTVKLRQQGKYRDFYPIFEMASKIAPRENSMSDDELEEFSQKITNSILEGHADSIVSYEAHVYEIDSRTEQEFRTYTNLEQSTDENDSKSLDDLLEKFKQLNLSEAIYNDAGNRQIKLLTITLGDLKQAFLKKQGNIDPERLKKMDLLMQKLFKDASFTIIIETDQRVKKHNAQRIQTIKSSTKKRYLWTFKYKDVLRGINSKSVKDPLVFILN